MLAVYFILLYVYIVTFCRAFFSLPSMNFWHILQIIIFLQCTDYFWHPFGIIFFVQSELFLVTLHELFLATVNLISGSVMHCVTLTCMSINGHTGLSSSRHYENME